MSNSCPVCGGEAIRTLVELPGVPIFCNVQYDSKDEARSQPVGEMRLVACSDCSHIFNSSFEESLLQYGQSYENSLHYSTTFSSFAEGVASQLVERFALRNKRVVDIGCGKGDFLSLLCELGANDGFGFDQSYQEGRAQEPRKGSVQYFRKYFGPEHKHIKPDFVTCRHVLEHIPKPARFLEALRRTLAESGDCGLYFEVPNAMYTVRDLGVWDIIYEHCQYFTEHSLAECFRRAGFEVDIVHESFGGQFLGMEGSIGSVDDGYAAESRGLPAAYAELMGTFESRFAAVLESWRTKLDSMNGGVVVWGGGSKGVTFLNLVDTASKVSGVVDINPHKQGKYVPASGHLILAPAALRELEPEHVLIMNPLYESEITRLLSDLGLNSHIHLVI